MRCFSMLAVGVATICVLAANVAFMVSGIIIIVLGNLMLADLDQYAQLFDGVFSATPIAVISIGAIALAIGFCGFFGVLVKNRSIIIVYASLLFLVLVAKLAVGIAALVEYQRVGGDLQERLKIYFDEEYTGAADLESSKFDQIQNTFSCCGVLGATDFIDQYGDALPSSCCYGSPVACVQNNVLVHQRGCSNVMADWVAAWFQLLGVVALAVILVELVLLILSSCLAKHWKKNKTLQTV